LIHLVRRRSSPVLVEEGLDDLTIGKEGGQVNILSFKDVHFVVQVKEKLPSFTGLYVTLCILVFFRKLSMTTHLLLRMAKRITGSFRVSHFLDHVKEKACRSLGPAVRRSPHLSLLRKVSMMSGWVRWLDHRMMGVLEFPTSSSNVRRAVDW
jgi:hypothetical protein